jgi:hypothetical protein
VKQRQLQASPEMLRSPLMKKMPPRRVSLAAPPRQLRSFCNGIAGNAAVPAGCAWVRSPGSR